MKRTLALICFILALVGGLYAGWIDFNNDEPQAAVLLILPLTFLLGLIQPRNAWLWAIIVACCLPGVYLLATTLGYQPASPPSPGWYASFLALIPAFLGVYLGVLARLLVNALRVQA
jgi:glycopeptide antibiotics resistance protein